MSCFATGINDADILYLRDLAKKGNTPHPSEPGEVEDTLDWFWQEVVLLLLDEVEKTRERERFNPEKTIEDLLTKYSFTAGKEEWYDFFIWRCRWYYSAEMSGEFSILYEKNSYNGHGFIKSSKLEHDLVFDARNPDILDKFLSDWKEKDKYAIRNK